VLIAVASRWQPETQSRSRPPRTDSCNLGVRAAQPAVLIRSYQPAVRVGVVRTLRSANRANSASIRGARNRLEPGDSFPGSPGHAGPGRQNESAVTAAARVEPAADSCLNGYAGYYAPCNRRCIDSERLSDMYAPESAGVPAHRLTRSAAAAAAARNEASAAAAAATPSPSHGRLLPSHGGQGGPTESPRRPAARGIPPPPS
jgi:hypothetical protein